MRVQGLWLGTHLLACNVHKLSCSMCFIVKVRKLCHSVKLSLDNAVSHEARVGAEWQQQQQLLFLSSCKPQCMYSDGNCYSPVTLFVIDSCAILGEHHRAWWMNEIMFCACGQVRCGVAGSSDLFLSLTAACAEAQPEPGALSFQAAVGSSETKLLTLSNVDGLTDWHIRPVIRNSQWSGPDTAAVPAGMESSYELTYKPITQSTQVNHP